ncbi:hypothetical protein [Erwinia sp. JUb26]|uniref:hypothetical protein n=1 Tax=Erwinia sp. JUb26 TaxID=2485126 RepID=UPI000F49BC18|nr:hypothetical protein [Erwinia sp. JUb26]ROR07805.1 hypothetical protein EC836_106240 [Erwinia sp. JUb26]
MHITVRKFSTPMLSDAVSYLVSVDKRDGKNNEYVVEIARLNESMYCVFDEVWSEEYLRNCCWMVSFYTLDALFSLELCGRFEPDKRMAFTRRELEHLR